MTGLGAATGHNEDWTPDLGAASMTNGAGVVRPELSVAAASPRDVDRMVYLMAHEAFPWSTDGRRKIQARQIR